MQLYKETEPISRSVSIYLSISTLQSRINFERAQVCERVWIGCCRQVALTSGYMSAYNSSVRRCRLSPDKLTDMRHFQPSKMRSTLTCHSKWAAVNRWENHSHLSLPSSECSFLFHTTLFSFISFLSPSLSLSLSLSLSVTFFSFVFVVS